MLPKNASAEDLDTPEKMLSLKKVITLPSIQCKIDFNHDGVLMTVAAFVAAHLMAILLDSKVWKKVGKSVGKRRHAATSMDRCREFLTEDFEWQINYLSSARTSMSSVPSSAVSQSGSRL